MKQKISIWGLCAFVAIFSGCIGELDTDVGDTSDVGGGLDTLTPPIGPVDPCSACNGAINVTTGEVDYFIPKSMLSIPSNGDLNLNWQKDAPSFYSETWIPEGASLFVSPPGDTPTSASITFTGDDGKRHGFALMIESTIPAP